MLSYVVSVSFLLFYLVMMFVMMYVIQKDYPGDSKPEKNLSILYPKWTTLFADLRKDSKGAQYYSVVFLGKRFLYASLLVYVTVPFFQVYALAHLSLASIVYIMVSRPFEKPYMNTLELLNETMILVCCYHLLFFSDANLDLRLRYLAGWSLDLLIIVQFLFNVVIEISQLLLKARLILKARCLKYMAQGRKAKVYQE